MVDRVKTTASGFFTLCDANATEGSSDAEFYWVAAEYNRDTLSAPSRSRILPATGFLYLSTSYAIGWIWPNAVRDLGVVSLNAPGDTTSQAGDLAAMWATQTELFGANEADGEFRHRKNFGSANDWDLIRYRYRADVASRADCNDSIVDINTGDSRSAMVAYLSGSLFHGRLVGCSGDLPAFPKTISTYFAPSSFHDGGEGIALLAAVPQFMVAAWAFDRNTAAGPDLRADWQPCVSSTARHNTNDASSYINNALALWELVDADTTGTDDFQSDTQSLSIKSLFDGLLSLRNTAGNPGQNRTADEQTFLTTLTSCTDSEQCPAGQICNIFAQCVSGDVHGANIRDWSSFLPSGGWQTMVSSPCVGTLKDTFPFDGGYHGD
ncbi:MAG: hypothetical protein IT435_20815 [Phycisphaerales bacterium]|nr:hypothetical protein [Phycisphaerales bacterium]